MLKRADIFTIDSSQLPLQAVKISIELRRLKIIWHPKSIVVTESLEMDFGFQYCSQNREIQLICEG